VFDVKLRHLSAQHLLLATGRKGAVRYVSGDLADLMGHTAAAAQGAGNGPGAQLAASVVERTLQDLVPAHWRDMAAKYIKVPRACCQSRRPPGRSGWAGDSMRRCELACLQRTTCWGSDLVLKLYAEKPPSLTRRTAHACFCPITGACASHGTLNSKAFFGWREYT
jgi:hypothetical protein